MEDEGKKRETMIMWDSTKVRALKKMQEFQRQGIPLHSQDDLLNYLMDNLKSSQDLIKEDLQALKAHLIGMGEVDRFLKIEAILRPLTTDEILSELKDFYIDAQNHGVVSDKDFRKICKNMGIKNTMVGYYKKKVLEELGNNNGD